MDTKTLFGVLLIAGIVGGFSINSYFMNNETIEDNIIDVEVGNEAPNFAITDTEGNSFNLSDFENEKVVVLEFMNMGCGSCHNFEKNVLKSYCNNTTMPEDVKVISLTQTENEDKDKLEERAEDKNWAYALGSEEMTDAFGADRSPSIVIIDKDGMITFSESGSMTKAELEEKINEALE
jgi:peroxiredoxin